MHSSAPRSPAYSTGLLQNRHMFRSSPDISVVSEMNNNFHFINVLVPFDPALV
jgi:hypothetical protein